MLPVCSTTPCCSSHSQISFHGAFRPFGSFSKDFESRSILEERVGFGSSNGLHMQGVSFRTQAAKSLYSDVFDSSEQSVFVDSIKNVSCSDELSDARCKFYGDWGSSVGAINEMQTNGIENLKNVETYSFSAMEQELGNSLEQSAENAEILMGTVEPQTALSTEITPESPNLGSDSIGMIGDSLSETKASFDDFLAGVTESISNSVSKGENAVKSTVDTINSSVASITESASEAVDNAWSKIFSSFDQTGELAGSRLTNVSDGLTEAASKAATISVDVLRSTIVAVEDWISKGSSLIVYSYGNVKELLPPQIKDTLNLSEEKVIQIYTPIGSAVQQIYVGIEGLERSLGLDPNDPVVPVVLALGTSATLWVCYWAWSSSGYSGDFSPESTLELLTGKDDAVLIDVRPEVMRERNGIPDLRRTARFRYVNVTLSAVDGPVKKLVKGGRDLDDALLAAVIRNLKAIKDRSMVIVMDADGDRSKGIARSLRKLGVKRAYLVEGGFQSWVKQGLRIKELKPETTLTILNEEAEAILEEIKPSPVQALGYAVGLVTALYALLEWEKTLQVIGIFGLGQTIYRRVASYENPKDFKQDVRWLLAPVRLGAQAFSWAAGKLETNRLGLPTSPSSSDVQNRVLQAAAKHESQPSDVEGIQNPSPESAASLSESVDLSEA
ncbi:hypothetical protein K2173_018990 [Erythroxylum novogranatense]|uniref:Rhodanese domain-containing protein n=1 Tax=Erythroxylum novogranatense TaxID=1862640 RepID=A0AAV8SSE2_9ROSI|nr:hypothetical protein K2173_018990 [Erythroxylum novogranatense]